MSFVYINKMFSLFVGFALFRPQQGRFFNQFSTRTVA